MDEKLEKGIGALEYILYNMFSCFVVYYSTLVWFYFNRENGIEYKFINDIKNLLLKYNDLILFIAVTTTFIAIFIRILFYDHGLGIKENDNSIAVSMLGNASQLERIGFVLFLAIIPLSLYYNPNNSFKYILILFLLILISAIISKIVLLIKRKINRNNYY